MVPYENTAEEVSFELWHHRISSTYSKVKTTFEVLCLSGFRLSEISLAYRGQYPEPKISTFLQLAKLFYSFKFWSSSYMFYSKDSTLNIQRLSYR